MKLKTLKVFGEKQRIPDFLGFSLVYPAGTRRFVRSYFLFPKTLNKETRKGFQYVEQISTVEDTTSADGTIYYTKWKNSRFIDSSLLKKLIN